MELNSAIRIADQFIKKIDKAVTGTIVIGEILKEYPKVKAIDIAATVTDKKLLNAILLECSTPIRSSDKKLVRLYQNVQVTLHLR